LELVSGERYEPDLFVVPAIDGGNPPVDVTRVRPLLICEVLSPGSSRHDRITKRRAFQANGAPEYWIVDGDAFVFEIWNPDDERPAVVDDTIVWLPVGASEPLRFDVAAFFASVADGAPLP
jgi:Uma2 family endonuclease